MSWGLNYPGELPTLGSQIVDWVSEYLIVPDGPTAGEPLVLTGEQALLVLQLCIRRVLSRPRAEGSPRRRWRWGAPGRPAQTTRRRGLGAQPQEYLVMAAAADIALLAGHAQELRTGKSGEWVARGIGNGPGRRPRWRAGAAPRRGAGPPRPGHHAVPARRPPPALSDRVQLGRCGLPLRCGPGGRLTNRGFQDETTRGNDLWAGPDSGGTKTRSWSRVLIALVSLPGPGRAYRRQGVRRW